MINKRQHAIIFEDNIDERAVPIDCPLCKLLMKDADDVSSFMRSFVCKECEDAWADPNREKWLDGWRPSKEKVKIRTNKTNKTRYVKI